MKLLGLHLPQFVVVQLTNVVEVQLPQLLVGVQCRDPLQVSVKLQPPSIIWKPPIGLNLISIVSSYLPDNVGVKLLQVVTVPAAASPAWQVPAQPNVIQLNTPLSNVALLN